MAARAIGPVDVEALSIAEAVAMIGGAIVSREPRIFAFANAHSINLARDDPGFAEVLKGMTVLNDGVGLDLWSKAIHGAPFPANLNGTDLTPIVLAALDKPTKLFLLGSTDEVCRAAAEAIAARFPMARIVGHHHGFFPAADEPALAARIRAAGADLVLAGMGQPRQEYWARRNAGPTGAVILCIGAWLDFVSGRIVRAPGLVRKLRLEWVYRLMLEPRRLGSRYLVGNVRFLFALRKATRRR
ncbi:WecB/TagA/CpsF family glycosyltransferase [Sphingomonas bacterium]|uniref:WecB/TagA/CpsF family glycosyltransferase n=1 Tax=Sphingomonas bacterium TaxID=1895847 RepID=UPI0015757A55|nr:WecB/TagA/CpsF family glycosyltransferase [Sphingomonas bacterium]